jgi:hypothetical protein
MITKEELIALVELLNRTPMTHAEKLFIHALILRIEQEIVEQEAKAPA